jgi:hypothetical protein
VNEEGNDEQKDASQMTKPETRKRKAKMADASHAADSQADYMYGVDGGGGTFLSNKS